MKIKSYQNDPEYNNFDFNLALIDRVRVRVPFPVGLISSQPIKKNNPYTLFCIDACTLTS